MGNEEMSLRLNQHYSSIPMEALEAWLEPVRRANRESEAVRKEYADQNKVLTIEQAQSSIEISNLRAQLTNAEDEEKRLQKKVVNHTMLIEQLTEIKDRGLPS